MISHGLNKTQIILYAFDLLVSLQLTRTYWIAVGVLCYSQVQAEEICNTNNAYGKSKRSPGKSHHPYCLSGKILPVNPVR